MQLEVSKRAQQQWLRILVYYNEKGGQCAAANLHQKYLKKKDRLLKYPESGFLEPLLSDGKFAIGRLLSTTIIKSSITLRVILSA